MSDQAVTPRPQARLSTRSLADLRQAAGMSLRQLERATGISNGLLSLMERGVLVPDRKQLDALTRALGLPEGSSPHVRIEIEWVLPA